MERDPAVGLTAMLRRALERRCPRCGGGPMFRSFYETADHCSACGFRFEREAGYWVGAMIVNTAVTFSAFLIVLVGGMLILWPEVPWMPLFVGTVIVTLVVPVVFYPWSKAVWSAIELSYHQLEPAERAGAEQRLGGPPNGSR